MLNLISIAGPQQGVFRYPRCEKNFGFLCGSIDWAIKNLAYWGWIQKTVTPLTYWHDPNESKYKSKSSFLAIINNEVHYNANYVTNLNNLKRLVLVKYKHDGAIVPKSSSWFGYFNAALGEFPMEQTAVYKNDRLGLKSMVNQGKLIFLEAPRDHLELDANWFIANIIPLLKEK